MIVPHHTFSQWTNLDIFNDRTSSHIFTMDKSRYLITHLMIYLIVPHHTFSQWTNLDTFTFNDRTSSHIFTMDKSRYI